MAETARLRLVQCDRNLLYRRRAGNVTRLDALDRAHALRSRAMRESDRSTRVEYVSSLF